MAKLRVRLFFNFKNNILTLIWVDEDISVKRTLVWDTPFKYFNNPEDNNEKTLNAV